MVAGNRIGFDPWLHTADAIRQFEELINQKGGKLVPLNRNPVDEIWTDQPSIPLSPIVPHDIIYSKEAAQAYGRANQDLAAAYGDDHVKLERHFKSSGYLENRNARPDGLPTLDNKKLEEYLKNNPDVLEWAKNAITVNKKGNFAGHAALHWFKHGKAEGRTPNPEGTPRKMNNLTFEEMNNAINAGHFPDIVVKGLKDYYAHKLTPTEATQLINWMQSAGFTIPPRDAQPKNISNYLNQEKSANKQKNRGWC